MKTIQEEFRYEHPVAEVFALISQGVFQTELISHLGGKEAAVIEETATPSGIRLVTRQRASVELPGFAKKLIPADSTVTQTYDWGETDDEGGRTGTWSAAIKGAPISIGGPIELVPDGTGAVLRYLGQIKASVPLVGGKLESFALDNLRRDLGKTFAFTVSRLEA